MPKIVIIDTLFMVKTAEKPYPLGPHIPITYHSGVPPELVGEGPREANSLMWEGGV